MFLRTMFAICCSIVCWYLQHSCYVALNNIYNISLSHTLQFVYHGLLFMIFTANVYNTVISHNCTNNIHNVLMFRVIYNEFSLNVNNISYHRHCDISFTTISKMCADICSIYNILMFTICTPYGCIIHCNSYINLLSSEWSDCIVSILSTFGL